MDTFELKKEQLKLAPKVELRDGFSKIKTIGGAACFAINNKLLATVVVCEFPSLKLLEKKTYLLSDPLNYQPGFLAYREMPAIIEAYNQLEQEPDLPFSAGRGNLPSQKNRLGFSSGTGFKSPHHRPYQQIASRHRSAR